MHDNRALWICMQAMVLLDLVFVQITGAAGLQWLAPLYALTLAAPLLTRFHEVLAYRLLWNGAVLCFFATLLSHALSGSLAYVLEDGLVLAVLCQVHLLNNLRATQRPDLLFFNAFLIATITGFMTREVGFAATFLVFVPFFVIGQQLQSAARGGKTLTPSVTRKLIRDGFKHTGYLLVASLLAFLFWPRDFNRKPFLGNALDLGRATEELQVGFNESLELNRSGKVTASNRMTLQVTVLEGTSANVPSLWRGATLGSTKGGAWLPSKPTARRAQGEFDERWRRHKSGLERDPMGAQHPTRIAVERFPQDSERLFLPLGASDLRMSRENQDAVLHPRHDGTIDCTDAGDLRYELSLTAPRELSLGGVHGADLRPSLTDYVELPPDRRIELATRLAQDLALRDPVELEQYELVERIREHLAWTYAYLPPGAEGAAESLEEFLMGKAGGHCEFFASALATMLRSLKIPCRVVTGYRSTNWDATNRVLTFGESNAHAWVEVFDPNAGWYAVDASPFQVESQARVGHWAKLTALARGAWDTVTNFNGERRSAVYAWGLALPARLWRAGQRNPLRAFGLGLAGCLTVWLTWQRRRARFVPSVHAYEKALRVAKLELQVGETPRERLARAEDLPLAADHLAALRAATQEHERARYAA